jgi:uncharacterized membrane protein
MLICILGGLVIGLGTAFSPATIAAPLLGWIGASGAFVIWTGLEVLPQDPQATASHARREDPSRPAADVACLLSALASLVAVGILLLGAGNAQGSVKLIEVALSILAVLASWALVHTIFMLRYARMYFASGLGAIDFNQDAPPRYSDFAYIAITVGLTFQVSDTDLRSSAFRRLATKHMLMSYLMGAIVVAITINLVAGMVK